jgi:hypothetical protein
MPAPKVKKGKWEKERERTMEKEDLPLYNEWANNPENHWNPR